MKTRDIHILLVDDERDILEILEYNLSKEGYQIRNAGNGKDALTKAEECPPDLVLLDLMMPGMDGIETCKQLRKLPEMQETIIAFLTARGDDHTEMAGYRSGADDYIKKPVRPNVLVSKVSALLRRLNPEKFLSIEIGDLRIDQKAHQAVFAGESLNLPRKEFKLLTLLAKEPERVFSRDYILAMVWGDQVVVGDRTIDVHIRKLREKIGNERIKTVTGVGYKYVK